MRPTLLAVSAGAAALSSSASASSHGSSHWEARFLDDYPLALCNDGSAAAYYYRKGPSEVREWTVFLEGGAWCWDVDSCAAGGSSVGFPSSAEDVDAWAEGLQGLISRHSPLAHTHFAFVRSCSADAFMGDAGPSPGLGLATETSNATAAHARGLVMHFRGRRILEAVFADLRQREGLGDHWLDRVLFSGCGSGARGAMLSMDHVATHWVGKADLIGLLDSPLWIPVQPWRAGLLSLEEQTKKVLDVANVTQFLDRTCLQQFPGALRWRCMFGAYVLPFITSPFLLVQSQYDSFGILSGLDLKYSGVRWLNSTELVYAEAYRKALVANLPREFRGDSAVFSSACYVHCTFQSEQVFALRAGGVSLPELLERWLVSPASVRGAWFRDDCTGFNCGLVAGGDRAIVT